MKLILTGENDKGQRLDRFLSKSFPSLTQGLIRKGLRDKNIKVNGKRQPADYRLESGDEIKLYLKDELFEARHTDDLFTIIHKIPDELSVIYEDNNIILIDKPPGLVVHEDENNTPDTLINRIKKYLYIKGEFDPAEELTFAPALCNRIDRNTGGIVIAAKNAEALRILNQKIKDREITKKYLCLVSGIMPKKEDILTGYLKKNELEKQVTVYPQKTADTLTIRTGYRVIAQKDGISLLEVTLYTGRTHQIRAHLSFEGHPLIGDGKYGRPSKEEKKEYPYQALYSYKLGFSFTSDGGILEYLNKREFEIHNIWFLNKFYKGKEIMLK